MIDRFAEGLCACCARREIGRGYVPKSARPLPPLWLCDDIDCIALAKAIYSMKQDTFDRIESRAAQEGGNEGLWYLDDIGKTDLTTLTVEELCEFKRRMIAGYRKQLQAGLRAGAR